MGSRTTGAKVIFVQIQASSQVIPLPGVPTLFLDVKTPEDITDSKVPQSPQVFRGFQLFQITIKGGDPPSAQVAVPVSRVKQSVAGFPDRSRCYRPN